LKAIREQHAEEPNACELKQAGQTEVRQQLVDLIDDFNDEFKRLVQIDLSVVHPKLYLLCNVE
jgi:hypothetical protein